MSLTTATRQHGTAVHTCETAADFAAACQHVLDHGYAKVNGVTIDSTTAGMVKAVWEKLTPKNREVTEGFWQKRHVIKPGMAVVAVVKLFWKFVK